MYQVKIITDPAEEPITLLEAKEYLRVDNDAEDVLIAKLISGARISAERFTNEGLELIMLNGK